MGSGRRVLRALASGVDETARGSLEHQAGEAARIVGAGVDADAVGRHVDLGRDGVAMHHDLAEIGAGVEELVPNPE